MLCEANYAKNCASILYQCLLGANAAVTRCLRRVFVVAGSLLLLLLLLLLFLLLLLL